MQRLSKLESPVLAAVAIKADTLYYYYYYYSI